MSDLDLYADGRAIGADQLEALVHKELVAFRIEGEGVTQQDIKHQLYIQAQTEDHIPKHYLLCLKLLLLSCNIPNEEGRL